MGDSHDEPVGRDVDVIGDDAADPVEGVQADDDLLVLEEVDTTPTLPVWEPTGDPAVDAALEELAMLDERDRSEHIEVFESVHRRLHDRLSGLTSSS